MNIQNIALVLCFTIIASQDYTNQPGWDGVCGDGKKQSPVNIADEKVVLCPSDTKFEIQALSGEYVQTAYNHNNKNIKTPFNLSIISLTERGQGRTYNAAQFHFHVSSEHNINSKPFDAELHIVHAHGDAFAVFGILFKADSSVTQDPFDNWHLDTI